MRLLIVTIAATLTLSACISDDGGGSSPDTSTVDAGGSDVSDTSSEDAATDDAGQDVATDVTADVSPDTTTSTGGVGDSCQTADDCDQQPALCLSDSDGFPDGYCVVEGCETSEDCPTGSSCWSFQDDSTRCLQNCSTREECRNGYYCDADDTCWPGDGCSTGSCGAGEVCEEATGRCVTAPCSPGSCEDGLTCSNGECVLDLGEPPSGTIPACENTVSWECDGTPEECAELVPFEPVQGTGYWNYPINGETSDNQYRSYIRRDTRALIKYAAAKVDCKARGWSGNGGPIGLGDMSEADGAIPGTSDGNPGHPQGTHVDGYDIDIAYYQRQTSDNRLRAVCPHTENGEDVYHCVGEPVDLDVWRTALFLAHLHDAVIHNRFQTRVVGVDGRVGPLVESAIEQLCSEGWYRGPACNQSLIAYETTDEGRGWYYFHHHHLHLSINGLHPDVQPLGPVRPASEACIRPGCPNR